VVRVEGPGHAPLEEIITLKQGEMRVVVFQFKSAPETP
jgi:hypothetical protein